MGESPRQLWVRTAVFLGIGYALVGILFAVPATHLQAWRLGAWVVSAIGYAAHIAYERFRLQNSPGWAALHVAFAVALGAFGLAVGANIHSLSVGSTQHRHFLLLSLGIWPVITALPAFLVAFGTNLVLERVLGSVDGSD
jgi:nitrate reductase NapE component